jgi:hypothetical protein
MEASEAMSDEQGASWDDAERARMRGPDESPADEGGYEPDMSEAEAAMEARIRASLQPEPEAADEELPEEQGWDELEEGYEGADAGALPADGETIQDPVLIKFSTTWRPGSRLTTMLSSTASPMRTPTFRSPRS